MYRRVYLCVCVHIHLYSVCAYMVVSMHALCICVYMCVYRYIWCMYVCLLCTLVHASAHVWKCMHTRVHIG